jgi:hypothetical protein
MSSEKSRYLNRGPSSPLNLGELKRHLRSFEHERLVELLWLSAQNNSALRKAVVASISMQLAEGDWDKTKEAIDYAFYFQDSIRYSDCRYGIILYEMINALEILKNQVSIEFSLRVAHYILENGQDVIMNFEDDWNWTLSLEELEEWIKNNQAILNRF